MKHLLFTFFMVTSALAVANVPASWTQNQTAFYLPDRFKFDTRVYFNCDAVEGHAERMLKEMGARNIQVHCSGGIDRYLPEGAWTAYIEASFETLRQGGSTSADWETVNLRSLDNCFLMSTLFHQFVDKFDITNLNGPNSCMYTDSSFRASFSVLKN